MENFRFHMYTDIVFGRGAEEQAGKKVREYGGTKVMLLYGGGSIKKSGLYDKVVKSLQAENIPFVEFSGIQPNPLLSMAYKGLELVKKEGVDFLLAAGGGSTIDTAKGIALGMRYDGDLWDFYTAKVIPTKMAPIGTIPTIAAAGSETSRSTVLVHDELRLKLGLIQAPCRPTFSLLNPEWTFTLPAYQTAAGGTDIFAHVVERYFYPDDTYLGDKFAEGLMRTVIKYAPIALADPQNYTARAEISLAAAMAHNDFAGLGHYNLGWEGGCHAIERPISGLFNTTHGAGLAVIMPAWMTYTCKKTDMSKHIQFATRVFDVEMDSRDPEGVAMEGIRRFKVWLKLIGMPVTLKELGLNEENIKLLIKGSSPKEGKTIGQLVKLGAKDVENIINSAF